MQVFVPYSSPIKVAKCLDKRRLNKQIIECRQILKAINGETNAWKNHPVVKMYSSENNKKWLLNYMECLEAWKEGNIEQSNYYTILADTNKPLFLTEEFCNQHKRRLYSKSPELYQQFAKYGKSDENWYIINNELKIFRQNK